MNYSKLAANSKDASEACLFFCKGNAFKRDYLLQAIEKGAKAYVSEKDYDVSIPCILVPDIKIAMAEYAREFYDCPEDKLTLAGITGTKGKSTTLYFLISIMNQCGFCGQDKFGYVSTIDNFDGAIREESHLTTPETLELHQLLFNMVENGLEYAGMEVSSQALKYDRSYGLHFRLGGFTNFSEDHISPIEHSDIEDYFSSKLKLIYQCDSFVVNLNSDRSELILDACKKAENEGRLKSYITIAADYENKGLKADFVASDIRKEDGLTVFEISGIGSVRLSMPGLFNVENALMAAVFALQLGASTEDIIKGLFSAKAGGRMEVFKNEKKDIVCIADFAHNEAAFKAIFSSVATEYQGYTIKAVFGAPGNKAYERRLQLPAVAAKYADYCYITEDDPFNEDPADICEEVYKNLLSSGGRGEVVVDRVSAIEKAFNEASLHTVILLLAKGRDMFMHRREFDPYISDTALAEKLTKE